jgi:mRNA interferase MazF
MVRRGELYRVAHPSARDPKRSRVFCVVSRQVLIDSKYSTVICAPVYTVYDGLATQVPLGPEDGMKHECGIHCDNLVSLQKSVLTNFVATLLAEKIASLDQALAVALDLSAVP